MRILLALEDSYLQNIIAAQLRAEGWQLDSAATAADAARLIGRTSYHVAIFDRLFPDRNIDGSALVRRIRLGKYPKTRVIMFSSRCSLQDRLRGLGADADDVLIKPFLMSELIACVKKQAVQLRQSVTPYQTLTFGALQLYPQQFLARLDKRPLSLTVKEFHTLQYFIQNPNRVISRRELMEEIWGEYDLPRFSNTINVHVSRLRKKIGHIGKQILTTYGEGYMLKTD